MRVRAIPALLIGLIVAGNSWAAEGAAGGEALLGTAFVDIHGSKAKFNEYGDLRGGVSGGFGLQVDSGNAYFGIQAGPVGSEDASVDLQGGSRGSFHYDFKYQEIPHRFGSGPAIHR